MGGATKLLLLLASPFPRPSALRLARRPAAPVIALSSSPSLRGHPSLLSPGPRLRLGFSIGAAEQAHTHAVSAREAYGEAASSAPSSSSPAAAHPWPEWLRLVEHVAAGGYADGGSAPAAIQQDDDDSFIAVEDLTDGFVKAAEACFLFARDRPDLIRFLSKKDIEIIVENGSPFLFKNGTNSTRRLKSFLVGDGTNVFGGDKVGTVDIMRYLLSNTCNFSAIHNEAKVGDIELIQASTRTLLAEIVDAAGQSSRLIGTTRHTTMSSQMPSRVPAQNIEMKRGDWICQKCSFMNFARNMRCLECNEARPKRVLTGGEWECPQCDFFNYGRNMSCLRCDCRRPGGENSLNTTAASSSGLGHNGSSIFEHIVKGSNVDRSEIERKLAANDEKAERWFSKMSQLGDAADLSNAIDDEDFPEIMPMRKGVNRFVVSTRKTPLERRLAAQNNSSIGEPGSIKSADLGSGGSESSISQSLDKILGRSSTSSGTNSQVASGERNYEAGSKFNSSEYNQKMTNQRRDSNYVPFVPLPPDMFRRQNANNDQSQKTDDFASTEAGQKSEFVHKSSMGSIESKNIDSSDSAERWSKNVAEPNIVKDDANSASDDFPDIMPLRKGENRFVISKKKDRTLTSPQYKRRMAMEQENNSSFVPFVPFPPDYFAKKDKQPPEASANGGESSDSEGMPSNEKSQTVPENTEEIKTNSSNLEFREGTSRYPNNQSRSHLGETSKANNSVKVINERNANSVYDRATSTSVGLPGNSRSNQNETFNSRYSKKITGASPPSSQQSSLESGGEDWKPSFSGKSLEGSAVSEEPDPLDMSEEAKAARWFRRVAQIKDISELSNIPDEDFPEIMPMRKGVNRFVVSKRKTPLERRLTSAQYRRNLPIISSEPEKETN